MAQHGFSRCGCFHRHIDAARIEEFLGLSDVQHIANAIKEDPLHVANSMQRNEQVRPHHTWNGKPLRAIVFVDPPEVDDDEA